MTRNLVILYNSINVELLYANGITFYKKDVQHFKTVKEVSEALHKAGYLESGLRCNPEILDYVMVITEYSDGLLVFCSDTDD